MMTSQPAEVIVTNYSAGTSTTMVAVQGYEVPANRVPIANRWTRREMTVTLLLFISILILTPINVYILWKKDSVSNVKDNEPCPFSSSPTIMLLGSASVAQDESSSTSSFPSSTPSYPKTSSSQSTILSAQSTSTHAPSVTSRPTFRSPWSLVAEDVLGDDRDDSRLRLIGLSYHGNELWTVSLNDQTFRVYSLSSSTVNAYGDHEWARSTELSSLSQSAVSSVAVSSDGGCAVFGRINDYGGRGTVLVLERIDNGRWIRKGETLSSARRGDSFGSDIALSNNADTVVTGACSGGFARVYEWSVVETTPQWIVSAELRDGESGGGAVSSLSMAEDGSRLVVGYSKNGVDDSDASSNDTVVFYRLLKDERLPSEQRLEGDVSFGYRVTMSADGSTVAVGTSAREYVSMYRWDPFTNEYTQVGQDVAVTDTSRFGLSLSLSSNGDVLVVGAYLTTVDGKWGRGKAFVFVVDDNELSLKGEFVEQDASSQWFGYAVSVSGDGQRLAISDIREDKNKRQGRVRVYKYDARSAPPRGGDE